MVDSWPLDAQFLGLALETFASRALGGDGVEKWAGVIHQNTSAVSSLVIDLLRTAVAFLEWFVPVCLVA